MQYSIVNSIRIRPDILKVHIQDTTKIRHKTYSFSVKAHTKNAKQAIYASLGAFVILP